MLASRLQVPVSAVVASAHESSAYSELHREHLALKNWDVTFVRVGGELQSRLITIALHDFGHSYTKDRSLCRVSPEFLHICPAV